MDCRECSFEYAALELLITWRPRNPVQVYFWLFWQFLDPVFNLLLDWEVERLRGGDKYFRDYVVLCEWDKEKDKDKDFRDDWCLCEVVPGPRQAKQVATERLFKFLLTQIPHPLLQLPLPPPLLLQLASNNNAPGFLTVCTKNSVVHQTMLHQNLSTAPVGAPKVFKKCQIEQTKTFPDTLKTTETSRRKRGGSTWWLEEQKCMTSV